MQYSVVGRGQFAMSEFVLIFLNIAIGPFLAFARFLVKLCVVRSMMTLHVFTFYDGVLDPKHGREGLVSNYWVVYVSI